MSNSTLLIDLVYALGAAFVGAFVATRLGQSAILGYIAAGIAVGSYTPGFVASAESVEALADVGVIFLLFAIGVQLSFRELLRVGKVAILGGSAQVLIMLGLGYAVGLALGWRPVEALFFGAVVSNSSSTVLGKIVAERGETDAEHGQIGLGWSTVQDLSTIVLVVVLSAVAGGGETILVDLLWAGAKAIIFLVLLIPVGLRVFPFIFERVAALQNREVFVLAVAAIALASAYLSTFFGLSLALGAFVAGVVVGESDLSHQILGEIVPLRDILAGLFFVSVGMLVDPVFVVQSFPLVLVVLVLVVLAKGVVTALIAAAFRYSIRTALLTGVVLAQSAEFSFLLARLGVETGAVSATVFSLMLAGAAGSIVLAPLLYRVARPVARWLEQRVSAAGTPARLAPELAEDRRRFAVLCGYGRVGSLIGATLRRRGISFIVIEQDQRVVRRLREQGIPVLLGHADNPLLLDQAKLDRASVLVIAIPDSVAARRIVEYARRTNPQLHIVARATSEEDIHFLRTRGVDQVVFGEREVAIEMAGYALRRFGVSAVEALAATQGMRRQD